MPRDQGESVLQTLLASRARGELLVLFHRNPGLIDTADGIARRIGRTASSIEEDLNELISLGLLTKKAVGRSVAIFLDRAKDKETQGLVAGYLTSLQK